MSKTDFETLHERMKEKINEARIEARRASNDHQDGYWDGYVLGMIAARTLLTEFAESSQPSFTNAGSPSAEEEK